MTVQLRYLPLISRVVVVGLVVVFLTGCRSGGPLDSRRAVPIIFDTDIGTDVDDAGALAILHILADRGEAEVLAAMSANQNRWCAPAIDVVNTYYGRKDMPIGCSRTGPDPEEWYQGEAFPNK